MTVLTDMAADLARILSSNEFDESGTYYPKGFATGFTARLIRGDVTTNSANFDQGVEATRTCSATLARASTRTAIAAIVGTARDPKRGDKITLSDGDWYVAGPDAMDVGDGVNISLERDDYSQAAGTGAVQVR
jgi:hypothetical protein